ncbi:hypothetical protein EMIHUDRAFT_245828 [Emiliania huxleyi CCMP1516]|uniref:Uncharacterized protein n=2 Tax=Emiliania huxleyi TaxID=2903 RepID=A0A0D3IW44_EMIH1|nr:hypothetical protein EMIHUDRAFT_245828 [Emiliania huxleyi CCMP1516]EOD15479.1 hypothetical protein EMIHUDRAFT_245828 [Emiliania huxleyi CCMP1516]|eukprot:XP_005767908.1 hypothetical protein EMIHUDRAFT_245828 [Emiliania huxleyi CCMP1516]
MKECCDFLVPRKKEVTYTLDIENPAWVPLGVGGIMTYVWYGLLSIPFLGNLLSSIYTFILSVFGLKPKEAVGSSPPLDYTLPLYFFPLSDQALLLGFLPLGWLWIGLIKISFGAFEPIYSLILGLWFGA